ncbi:EF-hand domain-containing protein [Haloferula sp.]|uniref:EF-hand domain-containing protein n=1 Tax=Haloferula sp. TaxID=2497595 RepID=UPI003C794006
MKTLTRIFPVVLIASCASTTDPTPEQAFRMADKDNDGVVGRQEVVDLTIANAFKNYDANGDGFVDQAEYLESGGTVEKFKLINKSGSGKVSLEEAQANPLIFNTFAVSFDEADVNKDGKVTYSEYQVYLAKRDAAVR